MTRKKRRKTDTHAPFFLLGLALPCALCGLFYLLRGRQPLMEAWVFSVAAPLEQRLGRLCAVVPFSVGEGLCALLLLWAFFWLLRALVLAAWRRQWDKLPPRLCALLSAALWFWCALCWLWNCCYYVSGFSARSGLEPRKCSVEELSRVTHWFAEQAAARAARVPRDAQGHFLREQEAFFEAGQHCYEHLSEQFPFLSPEAVRAKPLLCSRLQSVLGFTGVYSPVTGEANVNVDAPACLCPATIAHEMAHQRMIASELEANFVGIAASMSCEDLRFQYSGCLMGLIELSNALYPRDPQAWQNIVSDCFTPELSQDWDDNYYYWLALQSGAEKTAAQTYDNYLKGNGQSLGMDSYGACVDLLTAYFLPRLSG